MSDFRLPELNAAQIQAIAGELAITDFVTGARVPWKPSPMQIAAWRFSERNRRGFIGKPRRAYISTACDLEDVLQTVAADTAGHRIRTGVMLDTESKVSERTWQMADFLKQMDIEHVATDYYIAFPGGSEIVGLTAGGKRAAASTGFQRMRYSEASYYSNHEAITATSASVGKMGREMIETTVDIGADNGLQCRQIWDSPDNDFETLFLPFEMHLEYRADGSLITDDEWAWAQTEGFTRRDAAAYWLREIIPNKCAGDIVKAMHEYPQAERHMFQASSGIWIRNSPAVLEPVEVIRVLGPTGDTWLLYVYQRASETSGDLLITVDTATGKDKDRSVVCVVDKHSRKMVACFVSGTAMGDDVAAVIKAAYEAYSVPDNKVLPFANDVQPLRRPHVMIEDNTVGNIVIQPTTRLGIPHETFDTTEDSKYLGLLEAKRAVDSGHLAGPMELKEECDELRRDDHGRWKGRKDILMSYGFAALRIMQNPPIVSAPHVVQEERTVHIKDRIRRYARMNRGR